MKGREVPSRVAIYGIGRETERARKRGAAGKEEDRGLLFPSSSLGRQGLARATAAATAASSCGDWANRGKPLHLAAGGQAAAASSPSLPPYSSSCCGRARQRRRPLLLPPAAVTGGGAGGGSRQRRRRRGKQRRWRQQGNGGADLFSSSAPPFSFRGGEQRRQPLFLPPTAVVEKREDSQCFVNKLYCSISRGIPFAEPVSSLRTDESDVVHGVLQMLQGFSSPLFTWDENSRNFVVAHGKFVSHLSQSSFRCILNQFVHAATCLKLVELFIKEVETLKNGFPTLKAFSNSVSLWLKRVRNIALNEEVKTSPSDSKVTTTLVGLTNPLSRLVLHIVVKATKRPRHFWAHCVPKRLGARLSGA
ncbi:hypothetical protein Taro_041183 [Colocasia esculenta]|uniref:Gamma-tubulin complex component n=1 Tax=Colocasia esculenta TaxID=4460 RepID=A0A843WP33_COLES|nr:hypothetical protein [Colocasia esculenta]